MRLHVVRIQVIGRVVVGGSLGSYAHLTSHLEPISSYTNLPAISCGIE